jgi:nicotinamidase-related amidase
MRGGGLEGSFKNPNEFSIYYQLKYADEIDVLSDDKNFILKEVDPIIPEGSVLWVIDMQNDFIDAPVTQAEIQEANENLRFNVTEGVNIGNFPVCGGIACVKGINDLIEDNKSNFSRIVYTRDFHSPGHCSFGISGTSDLNGKYPGHCEYNSLGAAFNKDIGAKIQRDATSGDYFILKSEDENGKIPVDIIFKGYHSNADSYSGNAYSSEYPGSDTRQNINKDETTFLNSGCCQGDKCHGKTGGSILKNRDIDARGRIIFADEDNEIKELIQQFAKPTVNKTANERETISQKIKEDKELSEKIATTYFDDYKLPVPTGQGNIYVVGLAGEFCVKDTAINLKKEFNDKDVIVIQDLTRYVMTPFMLPLQRYELLNPNNAEKSKYGKFLPYGDWLTEKREPHPDVFEVVTGTKKSLTKYLFTFDGTSYTKKPANTIKNEFDSYKNDFHFASDIRPLIKDYYSSGVKMIFNPNGTGYKKIMETINTKESSTDENTITGSFTAIEDMNRLTNDFGFSTG